MQQIYSGNYVSHQNCPSFRDATKSILVSFFQDSVYFSKFPITCMFHILMKFVAPPRQLYSAGRSNPSSSRSSRRVAAIALGRCSDHRASPSSMPSSSLVYVVLWLWSRSWAPVVAPPRPLYSAGRSNPSSSRSSRRVVAIGPGRLPVSV